MLCIFLEKISDVPDSVFTSVVSIENKISKYDLIDKGTDSGELK